MIKRVSIEIIDHGLSNFDLPYRAIIGREYYVNFIRAAKRQGLCREFLEHLSMNCATCQDLIRDRASNLLDLIETAMGKRISGRDSDEVIHEYGDSLA